MQADVSSAGLCHHDKCQHPLMNICPTSSQMPGLDYHGQNTYMELNTIYVPDVNNGQVTTTANGLSEQASVELTGSFAEAYSHGYMGIPPELSDVQVVSELFPFVCGVCSLKFNNILDFYCHFKVHDFHKYTEKYFHVCDNRPGGLSSNSASGMDDVEHYRCGVCGLPFPSVCLLHDHLVNTEKAAKYTVDTKTKNTLNIIYTRENDVCKSDHRPNHVSQESEFSSKSCISIDNQNSPSSDVVKSEDMVVVQLYGDGDSNSVSNSKGTDCHDNKELLWISRSLDTAKVSLSKTIIKEELGGCNNEFLVMGTSNEMTDASKACQIVIADADAVAQPMLVNAVSSDDSKALIVTESELESTDHKLNENFTPCNDLTESKTVSTNGCDIKAMQNVSCKDHKQLTDKHRSVYNTRHSRRCDRSDDENKTTKNIDSCPVLPVSKKQGKRRSVVDQEHNDEKDWMRERKFDDPKRERRRLLMIRYQRKYRERKKLKALGLWNPKRLEAHSQVENGEETEEKLPNKVKNVSDVKVPCDVCGLLFKKKNLKRHTETHTDVKAYQCEICLKSFKTKGYLYGHKIHHRQVKDLICDYCGKAFNNGPNLRQHLKIHVREKSLQCPYCPKQFRSNYVLKDHIMRHSDAKPHMCQVCGRTFKVPQEVTRHMLVHTDERPHVCRVCHKGFKCRSNLVKHEKIHSK